MASTFIEAPQPWWIFNDATGKPLAGGTIYTYDSLTRDPKATYKDAAGLIEQEFPITLDASGMVDSSIFWELNGTSGYYIEIFDGKGDLLRSEDNFPLSVGGGGGGGPINEYFESTNYIDNIDFKFNNGTISPVPVGDTPVAPGGWIFRKAENFAVFDDIVFTRINLSSVSAAYNPEYLLTYTATSFTGLETEKSLLKKINNVKSFNNEMITISFYAFSTLPSSPAEIIVIQNFGTGGSPSAPNIQLFPFTFPGSGVIDETFTVASTVGKSLGTNGDDYIAIGFRYPLSTPGVFSVTRFSIIRGDLTPPNGFFDTPSQTFSKCIQDLLSTMFPFYTTGFVAKFFVDYGVINSVPTKYAISGFIGMENQTIGSASSAAVEANNQYMNLFIYLWMSTSQSACPVSGGRGVSAQADWAANKTITLPNTPGRVDGCVGTGSGLTPRVMAETFGEENHQITEPEMAAHNHTISPTGKVFVNAGTFLPAYTSGLPGITASSISGANVPHNTMQPTVFSYWYIKY
jgi:hypothetical protein